MMGKPNRERAMPLARAKRIAAKHCGASTLPRKEVVEAIREGRPWQEIAALDSGGFLSDVTPDDRARATSAGGKS